MLTCKLCKKEFKEDRDLLIHLAKEHDFLSNQVYEYYNYSFETGEATCPVCGKKFIMTKRQIKNYKKGNSKAIGCCAKCSRTFIELVYGNPSTWAGVNEKKKESYLKNYGVEHISQLPEIKQKVNQKLEETNLKKYGVKRPIQSKSFFEKMKQTNLRKYGSEYTVTSSEIKEKAKKTNIERYGVENAYQNPSIQEKAKRTNLERYGT
jgi:uncharacterized C2H2 Zn-finger protein